MLVLSRRTGESIVIKDNIVVTVVRIRGNQVHLAFEAPRETTIHRSEVHHAILRQAQDSEFKLEAVG